MIMRLSSDGNLCTSSASLATFHQDEQQTFVTKCQLFWNVWRGRRDSNSPPLPRQKEKLLDHEWTKKWTLPLPTLFPHQKRRVVHFLGLTPGPPLHPPPSSLST